SKVDFPAPFLPTNPTWSPPVNRKVISEKISSPEKETESLCTFIIACKFNTKGVQRKQEIQHSQNSSTNNETKRILCATNTLHLPSWDSAAHQPPQGFFEKRIQHLSAIPPIEGP